MDGRNGGKREAGEGMGRVGEDSGKRRKEGKE